MPNARVPDSLGKAMAAATGRERRTAWRLPWLLIVVGMVWPLRAEAAICWTPATTVREIPADVRRPLDVRPENAPALLAHGLSHTRAWTLRPDWDRAHYWIQKAAQTGLPLARHYLACLQAMALPGIQDRPRAVALLEELARGGLGRSQAALGDLYRQGLGVERDLELARRWEARAIESDDPEGVYLVAFRKLFGSGQPPDIDQGWALLLQAARMGLPEARFQAGMALAGGVNVAADPPRAMRWLLAAARGGHPHAAHMLGVAFLGGLDPALPRDPEAARRWLLRAAEAGLTPSQTAVGVAYLQGSDGFPPSPAWGYYWLRRAAGNGDAEARAQLAANPPD